MQFGFSLPSRGPAATTQNLRTLATHVEALGLDSVWVSDHILVPKTIRSFYPYDPQGRFPTPPEQAYFEPLTTLTFLAACTQRVQLGTSVLILPYRNVLLTAKVVATLDTLAGGRVLLGVGVGWMEEEFVALGLDTFHQRGAVTDEYIQALRVLWTSDDPRFEGRFVRFADIGFAPKPVRRPHPPIWVGGHTPAAIRRAARLGDGWHPIGLRPPAGLAPEEMRQAVAQLREEAARAGRNPQEITISFRAPLVFREAASGPRTPLTGSPAAIQEDIGRYADCGVSHLVFDVQTTEVAEMQRVMERFARDVLPAVRAQGQ
ncbi:MAG: F420-dependent oxidoreductase [Candidatus Tectimicrobiota bacterium]|nr:MAG: F420-dependent oxidoreductase [Candidatus Tectomicrobia bacterium]